MKHHGFWRLSLAAEVSATFAITRAKHMAESSSNRGKVMGYIIISAHAYACIVGLVHFDHHCVKYINSRVRVIAASI